MVAAVTIEQVLEHKRAGRAQQAAELCHQLLAIQPNDAQALHCLGEIAYEASLHQEALEWFTRAQAVAPESSAVVCNIGKVLMQLGDHRRAIAPLRKAVALDPRNADAEFRLGLALTYVGDLDAGFAALKVAAELAPNDFEIQRCFAMVLKLRGANADAVRHYERALTLDPNAADCWLELSNVHVRLQRLAAAEDAARHAIALNVESPPAWSALGWALYYAHQLDPAIAAFRRANELDPTDHDAHFGLGVSLQEHGLLDAAVTYLRAIVTSDPSARTLHSTINYLLPFMPGISADEILKEARSFSRSHTEPLRGRIRAHANVRDPARRLRVGYVSHEAREHCQSLFLLPLLAAHDRDQVEVCFYSSQPFPDAITATLRGHVARWREVARLSDSRIAECVRSDGVDILVDLMMHMGNGHLLAFAEKPAPVQCCWLAYPGTTGVATIDYRITDAQLDPADADLSCYSERSVILPDTFWCYDPLADQPETGPLPAAGNGFITFGCLNNFRKVNDAVLELWSRVLSQVPASRLLLLAPTGQPQVHIVDFMAQRGIDRQRIQFTERVPRPEYLALYRQIDIALDTFPYGGHTTSLDAFWMGVPVVSLLGSTVVGRACLTYARHLELTDLVARDATEFVNIAVRLANDQRRLQTLRNGLRAKLRASPLMDAPRFARSLESAYRAMWRLWCAGAPAERTPLIIPADSSGAVNPRSAP